MHQSSLNDEDVLDPRKFSRFIEKLVRPRVASEDLNAGYMSMQRDEPPEAEASEWAEALIGDALPEADDEALR